MLDFLRELAYTVPAVLIAITFHEFCHGYAAHIMGDPTPSHEGRLSLNPLRHLDPMGTLALVVFKFGWARPVMVDPRYFKNPKMGMALVGAAGPAGNFLLAFLSVFSMALMLKNGAGLNVVPFLYMLALINLGLGVFNLLPIPPLDGSKVVGALLPDRLYFGYMRYEMYGQIILIALLYLGFLSRPLGVARAALWDLMTGAASFILR